MTTAEMQLQADVLVPGAEVRAEALVLSAPISFWGGVNPQTGLIADVRHPQHGVSISGRVLCLPGTIGSSSAAAVLLELVYAGLAPSAIVLNEPDAILLLGLIVAREMGHGVPPALRLDKAEFPRLAGRMLSIDAGGRIAVAGGAG
ncbi:aconitase X swivel domain-containing protein [Phyllobacterium phragmitis]|uniref:Phosphomevalonate dehydratase small subunit-like domain-containing protein n=1 Tax=Phyllobacterium phragmitis TaxID=2670329 RepID=A0ABQ0GV01_9HYPH